MQGAAASDRRRLGRVSDQMAQQLGIAGSAAPLATAGPQHIVWSQVLVIDDDSILLGRHRSGQFEGEYTGFIGEVGRDEPTAEAACRILLEQTGLTVSPDRLEKRAVFHFIEVDPNHPDPTSPSAVAGQPLVEHEFICRAADTSGAATETEKMTPTRFPLSEIPFDNMPADDRVWYPRVIEQQRFLTGSFVFRARDIVKQVLSNVSKEQLLSQYLQ